MTTSATESSNENKNARDKVRRFIRFFLSLKEPDFFFHQTLTFPNPTFDAKSTRARLKKLLARKLFQGALFVQEQQQNDGIHFHVLLYFYREHGLPFAASKMFDGLSAQIFAAWKELNGGEGNRKANQLKKHTPEFESVWYLTLETSRSGTRAKGATNWWGKSKERLLIRNSTPSSKGAVQKWMAEIYPRTPKPLGLRFSARKTARAERESREVEL